MQLGFLPLLEAGVVGRDALIADAKSGVTGAGRGAQVPTLLVEAVDRRGQPRRGCGGLRQPALLP